MKLVGGVSLLDLSTPDPNVLRVFCGAPQLQLFDGQRERNACSARQASLDRWGLMASACARSDNL